MPRTRKTNAPADVATADELAEERPAAAQAFELDSEPLPPDSDLEQLLADEAADGEISCTIYRVQAPPAKRLAYVAQWSGPEFSRDRLRDELGGGEFKIYLKRRGRLFSAKTLLIEAPKRAAPPPASAVPQELLAKVHSLREQLAALAARPASPPPETEERMLQRMLMYKQLFAGTSSPGIDLQGIFGMVKEGIELAQKLGGGGIERTPLDILAEGIQTFGKPLADVLARKAAEDAQRAPAAAAPAPANLPAPAAVIPSGAPSPSPATNGQAPPPVPAVDPRLANLQGYVAWLAKQAEANADPVLYADLILDQVPREELSNICAPQNWHAALALDPLAQKHMGWFEELRAELERGLH